MTQEQVLMPLDWQPPAGVRLACSLRTGGVSPAPWASLNLGDHVGDEPARVARNRATFGAALGVRPVYLQQVHGTVCVALDRASADGILADGCLTRDRGVACTIMVADCLPVMLAARDGSVVGAAHAGWRGLAAGVIEASVHAMQVEPADVVAWLGPCIGPSAFEVGDEVKSAFEAQDPLAASLFKPHAAGKWLADLPGLARLRLRRLGIHGIHGNDGGTGWCTVSNPSRFFSHRRDRVSGRLAAAIWLA